MGKGFTPQSDPGGQKVAGSNPVAPTELRYAAKRTCGKQTDAQKNLYPFPYAIQLVESDRKATNRTSANLFLGAISFP